MTSGTLVQLDRHVRLLDVNRDTCRVTVQSGMTLATLNETLALYGLALPNLGDIEYQTVSGAVSTATHGTGAAFGCLSTMITGVELVTGDGSVVQLSAEDDPAAFEAAQVGLGALGVLSNLTLQCVPSFYLRAQEEASSFDATLEGFDDLAARNEHFEFYWVPRSRSVLTKRNNRVEGPPRPRSRAREWFDDEFVSNWAFSRLGRMQATRPRLARRLHKLIPRTGPLDYVDRSDRVFTSPRTFRFYEMEYGIPRSAAVETLRELRSFVESNEVPTRMPIEVRVAAADGIPLSMASGRDSCFVAVHVFEGQPYERYFQGIESIFRSVGGRPHWGKLHTQTAETLAPLYPGWDTFQQVRRRFDPEGRFTNPYLERVLG